jgi:hypothetical protein
VVGGGDEKDSWAKCGFQEYAVGVVKRQALPPKVFAVHPTSPPEVVGGRYSPPPKVVGEAKPFGGA